MKKFLAFLTLITITLGLNNSTFADDVKVTATVDTNQAPILNKIIPSYSPIVVKWNTIQSFSMLVKDVEWGPVNYMITPETWKWSVDVLTWTLSNTDRLKSWEATIYFKYLAPSGYTWYTKIIVTLNDWTSVTPLDIELYIY